MNRATLLVVIQFTLFALIGLAFLLLPHTGNALLRTVGLVLVGSGLVVAFLAITEHQRAAGQTPNVTPTPKRSSQLVTSGLYQFVRHPIYSGVLLCGFGAAVYQSHLVTAVLVAALYLLLSVKSRYEESLLRRAFRDYGEYMTRTGRFWPGSDI